VAKKNGPGEKYLFGFLLKGVTDPGWRGNLLKPVLSEVSRVFEHQGSSSGGHYNK